MIARTPWLERHFTDGLPLEMFPNVLERLRGMPARVEDRVRGVEKSVLTARHGSGWSILENVGHLLQTESLWAVRLDDFESGRSELTPARFDAARVGEAQFNDLDVKHLCAGFRVARQQLVGRLERLDDAVLRHVARHPRLEQPMRVVDLMLFIAEHDDHHLVTITQRLGTKARAQAGTESSEFPERSI